MKKRRRCAAERNQAAPFPGKKVKAAGQEKANPLTHDYGAVYDPRKGSRRLLCPDGRLGDANEVMDTAIKAIPTNYKGYRFRFYGNGDAAHG